MAQQIRRQNLEFQILEQDNNNLSAVAPSDWQTIDEHIFVANLKEKISETAKLQIQFVDVQDTGDNKLYRAGGNNSIILKFFKRMRVRLVSTDTGAVLFYGKIYEIDHKASQYGNGLFNVIDLECMDALHSLEEASFTIDKYNLNAASGTDRSAPVCDVIKDLLDRTTTLDIDTSEVLTADSFAKDRELEKDNEARELFEKLKERTPYKFLFDLVQDAGLGMRAVHPFKDLEPTTGQNTNPNKPDIGLKSKIEIFKRGGSPDLDNSDNSLIFTGATEDGSTRLILNDGTGAQQPISPFSLNFEKNVIAEEEATRVVVKTPSYEQIWKIYPISIEKWGFVNIGSSTAPNIQSNLVGRYIPNKTLGVNESPVENAEGIVYPDTVNTTHNSNPVTARVIGTDPNKYLDVAGLGGIDEFSTDINSDDFNEFNFLPNVINFNLGTDYWNARADTILDPSLIAYPETNFYNLSATPLLRPVNFGFINVANDGNISRLGARSLSLHQIFSIRGNIFGLFIGSESDYEFINSRLNAQTPLSVVLSPVYRTGAHSGFRRLERFPEPNLFNPLTTAPPGVPHNLGDLGALKISDTGSTGVYAKYRYEAEPDYKITILSDPEYSDLIHHVAVGSNLNLVDPAKDDDNTLTVKELKFSIGEVLKAIYPDSNRASVTKTRLEIPNYPLQAVRANLSSATSSATGSKYTAVPTNLDSVYDYGISSGFAAVSGDNVLYPQIEADGERLELADPRETYNTITNIELYNPIRPGHKVYIREDGVDSPEVVYEVVFKIRQRQTFSEVRTYGTDIIPTFIPPETRTRESQDKIDELFDLIDSAPGITSIFGLLEERGEGVEYTGLISYDEMARTITWEAGDLTYQTPDGTITVEVAAGSSVLPSNANTKRVSSLLYFDRNDPDAGFKVANGITEIKSVISSTTRTVVSGTEGEGIIEDDRFPAISIFSITYNNTGGTPRLFITINKDGELITDAVQLKDLIDAEISALDDALRMEIASIRGSTPDVTAVVNSALSTMSNQAYDMTSGSFTLIPEADELSGGATQTTRTSWGLKWTELEFRVDGTRHFDLTVAENATGLDLTDASSYYVYLDFQGLSLSTGFMSGSESIPAARLKVIKFSDATSSDALNTNSVIIGLIYVSDTLDRTDPSADRPTFTPIDRGTLAIGAGTVTAGTISGSIVRAGTIDSSQIRTGAITAAKIAALGSISSSTSLTSGSLDGNIAIGPSATPALTTLFPATGANAMKGYVLDAEGLALVNNIGTSGNALRPTLSFYNLSTDTNPVRLGITSRVHGTAIDRFFEINAGQYRGISLFPGTTRSTDSDKFIVNIGQPEADSQVQSPTTIRRLQLNLNANLDDSITSSTVGTEIDFKNHNVDFKGHRALRFTGTSVDFTGVTVTGLSGVGLDQDGVDTRIEAYTGQSSTTGDFAADRLPNHSADLLTTGTLPDARLATTITNRLVPSTGTTNHVLTKTASGFGWAAAQTGTSGLTQDQVDARIELYTGQANDRATINVNKLPTTRLVPTGGSANQVLKWPTSGSQPVWGAESTVNFGAIAANIIPDSDSARDIGSSGKRWDMIFGDHIDLHGFRVATTSTSSGGGTMSQHTVSFPTAGGTASTVSIDFSNTSIAGVNDRLVPTGGSAGQVLKWPDSGTTPIWSTDEVSDGSGILSDFPTAAGTVDSRGRMFFGTHVPERREQTGTEPDTTNDPNSTWTDSDPSTTLHRCTRTWGSGGSRLVLTYYKTDHGNSNLRNRLSILNNSSSIPTGKTPAAAWVDNTRYALTLTTVGSNDYYLSTSLPSLQTDILAGAIPTNVEYTDGTFVVTHRVTPGAPIFTTHPEHWSATYLSRDNTRSWLGVPSNSTIDSRANSRIRAYTGQGSSTTSRFNINRIPTAVTNFLVPTGGTEGQVVKKGSSGYGWANDEGGLSEAEVDARVAAYTIPFPTTEGTVADNGRMAYGNPAIVRADLNAQWVEDRPGTQIHECSIRVGAVDIVYYKASYAVERQRQRLEITSSILKTPEAVVINNVEYPMTLSAASYLSVVLPALEALLLAGVVDTNIKYTDGTYERTITNWNYSYLTKADAKSWLDVPTEAQLVPTGGTSGQVLTWPTSGSTPVWQAGATGGLTQTAVDGRIQAYTGQTSTTGDIAADRIPNTIARTSQLPTVRTDDEINTLADARIAAYTIPFPGTEGTVNDDGRMPFGDAVYGRLDTEVQWEDRTPSANTHLCRVDLNGTSASNPDHVRIHYFKARYTIVADSASRLYVSGFFVPTGKTPAAVWINNTRYAVSAVTRANNETGFGSEEHPEIEALLLAGAVATNVEYTDGTFAVIGNTSWNYSYLTKTNAKSWLDVPTLPSWVSNANERIPLGKGTYNRYIPLVLERNRLSTGSIIHTDPDGGIHTESVDDAREAMNSVRLGDIVVTRSGDPLRGVLVAYFCKDINARIDDHINDNTHEYHYENQPHVNIAMWAPIGQGLVQSAVDGRIETYTGQSSTTDSFDVSKIPFPDEAANLSLPLRLDAREDRTEDPDATWTENDSGTSRHRCIIRLGTSPDTVDIYFNKSDYTHEANRANRLDIPIANVPSGKTPVAVWINNIRYSVVRSGGDYLSGELMQLNSVIVAGAIPTNVEYDDDTFAVSHLIFTEHKFLTQTNARTWLGIPADNRLIPAGGTSGQVLKKASNTDYALEWGDDDTGSGGTGGLDRTQVDNRIETYTGQSSPTGEFDISRMPDLPTSQITTGTMSFDRLPGPVRGYIIPSHPEADIARTATPISYVDPDGNTMEMTLAEANAWLGDLRRGDLYAWKPSGQDTDQLIMVENPGSIDTSRQSLNNWAYYLDNMPDQNPGLWAFIAPEHFSMYASRRAYQPGQVVQNNYNSGGNALYMAVRSVRASTHVPGDPDHTAIGSTIPSGTVSWTLLSGAGFSLGTTGLTQVQVDARVKLHTGQTSATGDIADDRISDNIARTADVPDPFTFPDTAADTSDPLRLFTRDTGMIDPEETWSAVGSGAAATYHLTLNSGTSDAISVSFGRSTITPSLRGRYHISATGSLPGTPAAVWENGVRHAVQLSGNFFVSAAQGDSVAIEGRLAAGATRTNVEYDDGAFALTRTLMINDRYLDRSSARSWLDVKSETDIDNRVKAFTGQSSATGDINDNRISSAIARVTDIRTDDEINALADARVAAYTIPFPGTAGTQSDDARLPFGTNVPEHDPDATWTEHTGNLHRCELTLGQSDLLYYKASHSIASIRGIFEILQNDDQIPVAIFVGGTRYTITESSPDEFTSSAHPTLEAILLGGPVATNVEYSDGTLAVAKIPETWNYSYLTKPNAQSWLGIQSESDIDARVEAYTGQSSPTDFIDDGRIGQNVVRTTSDRILPASGTTGHFLRKASSGTEYAEILQVPSGGTTNHVLTKSSSGYGWSAIPDQNGLVESEVDARVRAFTGQGSSATSTFNANRIPNHSADLLTSGTIPDARISTAIARSDDIPSNADIDSRANARIQAYTGQGSTSARIASSKIDTAITGALVPTTGTTNHVLTKSSSGYGWSAIPDQNGLTESEVDTRIRTFTGQSSATGDFNANRLPEHSAALLTSGTIPDDRISTAIARTSAIPTVRTDSEINALADARIAAYTIPFPNTAGTVSDNGRMAFGDHTPFSDPAIRWIEDAPGSIQHTCLVVLGVVSMLYYKASWGNVSERGLFEVSSIPAGMTPTAVWINGVSYALTRSGAAAYRTGPVPEAQTHLVSGPVQTNLEYSNGTFEVTRTPASWAYSYLTKSDAKTWLDVPSGAQLVPTGGTAGQVLTWPTSGSTPSWEAAAETFAFPSDSADISLQLRTMVGEPSAYTSPDATWVPDANPAAEYTITLGTAPNAITITYFTSRAADPFDRGKFDIETADVPSGKTPASVWINDVRHNLVSVSGGWQTGAITGADTGLAAGTPTNVEYSDGTFAVTRIPTEFTEKSLTESDMRDFLGVATVAEIDGQIEAYTGQTSRTGEFQLNRIPNLDADIITSGEFNADRYGTRSIPTGKLIFPTDDATLANSTRIITGLHVPESSDPSVAWSDETNYFEATLNIAQPNAQGIRYYKTAEPANVRNRFFIPTDDAPSGKTPAAVLLAGNRYPVSTTTIETGGWISAVVTGLSFASALLTNVEYADSTLAIPRTPEHYAWEYTTVSDLATQIGTAGAGTLTAAFDDASRVLTLGLGTQSVTATISGGSASFTAVPALEFDSNGRITNL